MLFSRHRLRACLILISVLSTGCGRAERKSEEVRSALIHFPTLSRNLEDMTPDELESRIVSFPFENRGLSPLHISRISASCGCTVAAVDRGLLRPGEQGKIAIKIRRPAPGRKDVTITVFSNDPLHSSVILKLSWNAVAPVTFSPTSIDFGTLQPGEITERSVTVVRTGSDDTCECHIERVQCSPSERVQIFDEQGNSVHGRLTSERKLHLRLDAGERPGRMNGKVFLYLADCLEDRILLRVSWRVRPLIEVTPSSLYLDSGKPGEIRTGMIVISARRGDHLQVSQLLLAENSLQEEMESERLTNHSVRLKLKITFPSEPGIFQSHLALRCTSPVDKIIRVPVSGFVNIK